MATGLKTQGTQLYKVATATTAVEIGNITSFNPPSPSSDERSSPGKRGPRTRSRRLAPSVRSS